MSDVFTWIAAVFAVIAVVGLLGIALLSVAADALDRCGWSPEAAVWWFAYNLGEVALTAGVLALFFAVLAAATGAGS